MDADEGFGMELRNKSITRYNNIVLAKANKLFDDDNDDETPMKSNRDRSLNDSLDNLTSSLHLQEDDENVIGDSSTHFNSVDFASRPTAAASSQESRINTPPALRQISSPKDKFDSPPKSSGIGPKKKSSKSKKPSLKSMEAISQLLEKKPEPTSDALLLIEEASLRLRETFALEQLHEERQALVQKSRSASEAARKMAVDKSAVFAERIRQELDETATREAVRDAAEYISDVWNGRCASWRYRAFKKGGASSRALLYNMVTEPFTRAQVEWILQEIQHLHAPTEREQREHQDFIWKVVLAETLVKLYMNKFDLDKATAERSIADAPAEDGEDHMWDNAAKSKDRRKLV